MSKPANRIQSLYSQEAALLLGQSIRRARIERRMTIEELGERAGLSRGLVRRIEKGDPGCSIGAAFEAAAVVGVRLFDADRADLARRIAANAKMLALLPQAARASAGAVKDDF